MNARIFGPDFRPLRRCGSTGSGAARASRRAGATAPRRPSSLGHSYLDEGFSTLTALIDMANGKVLANLEEFEVTRDGEALRGDRLQLLGRHVRARRARFYATLSTGGKIYLVEGDVETRRARVIAEGVECPSLSPDEKRVAFKRRQGNEWRLHVLDLATGRETPLAETRSVDDQVEWLDDDRILYGLISDVWVVRADGRGQPGSIFRTRFRRPSSARRPRGRLL